MTDIKDLKVAVFEEWTDDPPAGSTKMYYIASGETAKDLAWLIVHPEKEALIKQGAWPGVTGPNREVAY